MKNDLSTSPRVERQPPAPGYRIVHVDTALDFRGGQQQLLQLARGLGWRGHQQLIVCPERSLLAERAREAGCSVAELPAYDPGHVRGALQLRRRLRAEPADLLHAHDGQGQTISALATTGLPVRRAASRLVMFQPKWFAGGGFLQGLKYEHTCHGVIAVCEYVKQLLVRTGVSASRIEVIPVGIDWPENPPGPELRARMRAQWGLREDDFVVGHLGAFTLEKGQDIAVEAAILLAPKLPGLEMLLAGEVSAQAQSRLAPRLRAAAGHARVLEFLENPSEFLSALDLFIMPSRAEGLPASVLLAMASGLGVVASKVGGLPEIVTHGKTGWLVPPDSPEALAAGILEAASDRARLREFGASGRARARQFSIEQMIARTEAFYARLVGRQQQE
ncbi:MAG: glycosyltransferase family 4 protein [Acidobacteriia bacterium]|nr:glycosyltransferase family 4 protein [Terriglobia bacterium]